MLPEKISKVLKHTWSETKIVKKSAFLRDILNGKAGPQVQRDLIKQYRYEIFNSYGPYKIITNGYGELKEVILTETGKILSAEQTYEQIKNAKMKEKTP